MRQLGEELPYATTVEFEKFEEEPSPKAGVMYRIDAVIWVERDGQKAIVIGKGGERLREIGSRARQQMERLFDAKVFLQTWVRAWITDATTGALVGEWYMTGPDSDNTARNPLGRSVTASETSSSKPLPRTSETSNRAVP